MEIINLRSVLFMGVDRRIKDIHHIRFGDFLLIGINDLSAEQTWHPTVR
jgi:hypothetical protein